MIQKGLCLLILFFSINTLISMEMIEEVIIEKRENIDYVKLQELFDNGYEIVSEYDEESKIFYLLMPTYKILKENKTANTIEVNPNEKKWISELLTFDKNGEYLSKIGKHGSFAKDGYQYLLDLNIYSDEIQLIADKFIAFDKNSFEFKYYIDSSSPIEPDLKLPIKACRDNRCYGEQPFGFPSEHYNSAFLASLSLDPQYSDVKVINSETNFFNIENYKGKIFHNLTKYAKIDSSAMIKAFVGIIWSEGIYLSNYYNIQDDNSYFLINGFATDILHYDENNNLIDSLYLKQISDIREDEINNFIKNHKPKNKTTFFSKIINTFTSENGNEIFLVLRPSKRIEDRFNSNRLLTIYSIKKKKIIKKLIPIDFYPIKYDYKKKSLIGVKIIDGTISLQHYRCRL